MIKLAKKTMQLKTCWFWSLLNLEYKVLYINLIFIIIYILYLGNQNIAQVTFTVGATLRHSLRAQHLTHKSQ